METVTKLSRFWWTTPIVTTSEGRKLRLDAIRRPLKGDTYLEPSGIAKVYNVLTATQDFAQRSRVIVKVKL